MNDSPVRVYVRGLATRNKGFTETVFSVGALALLAACTPHPSSSIDPPLRLMLDQPPLSLNPRSAIDANGQRLNALMFRALTRVDENLNAVPDLARSWKVSSDGRRIEFEIDPHLMDHERVPITAEKIAECLSFYKNGKPISPYLAAFPNWLSTESRGNSVVLTLSEPDPYLLKNLSALRYFRVQGETRACTEPTPLAPLVTSGAYFMSPWISNPESEMVLEPERQTRPDLKPLQISFVEDDNTRVLKLLRGEVDATQLTLSVAKSHWLLTHYPDRFNGLIRSGVAAGYMEFNLRDPILQDHRIREAITLAINRDEIIQYKLYGSGLKAGSLLAPMLPESAQHEFPYDPEKALQLLKEAGYGPDHRLSLLYKSTPVREGFEQGLMFKDMLARIGIDLVVEVVEPAVFISSIKKGKFQLFSSRWLGIADGSILYRTLYSKNPDNRGKYSNPKVDKLLDQAITEVHDERREKLMKEVQEIAAQDLPFFPLWYWTTELIYRKGAPYFSTLKSENLSLSGALEPMLVPRK